jgi:Uri superfamily endonuclease
MLGFSPVSYLPVSSLPSGITSYADNLSVGAYVYTGIAVNDVKTSSSTAYADTLSKGTYTYTGKTVTDLFAHNDTLSKGTYTYTGVNASDLLAKNDTLSKGTYTYAGISISDSKVIADILSVGSYSLVGKTVVDVLAKNDNLATGAYSYVGKDITDVKVGGSTSYADSLLTGSYSYVGFSLSDGYIGKTNEIIPIHGWIRDKKRKEILPPTALEIEAERIKLGIIEDRKEIKHVIRLLKQVEVPATRTQSSLEASKLAIHKKLLDERIKRADDEYQALLKRINENYLRARVEAHKAIKRQREEDDIIYVMSMIASM